MAGRVARTAGSGVERVVLADGREVWSAVVVAATDPFRLESAWSTWRPCPRPASSAHFGITGGTTSHVDDVVALDARMP